MGISRSSFAYRRPASREGQSTSGQAREAMTTACLTFQASILGNPHSRIWVRPAHCRDYLGLSVSDKEVGGTAACTSRGAVCAALRLLVIWLPSCLDLIQHSKDHRRQTLSFSEPPER
jgi:hypothetical protein